jgi:hypothetical protein
MQFQKIDIDFDIHRQIEAERRGFDEPPYVALRRLLGLPESSGPEPQPDGGVPWVEHGVTVPHGSEARMRYQRGRQEFFGKFLNGFLVVDGQRFDTLSAAAVSLARTKTGSTTSLNGWNYWEVRLPGAKEWRSLAEMRDEARSKLLSSLDLDLSL